METRTPRSLDYTAAGLLSPPAWPFLPQIRYIGEMNEMPNRIRLLYILAKVPLPIGRRARCTAAVGNLR